VRKKDPPLQSKSRLLADDSGDGIAPGSRSPDDDHDPAGRGFRRACIPWLIAGVVGFVASSGACGGSGAKPAGAGGGSDAGIDESPPDTQQILDPGACTTPGATGTTATSLPCACNSECQSGFCTDGVCCQSACQDTCMSCGLPDSLGVCRPVPAGLKPSLASECPISDPDSCGTDGKCDGRGACRVYLPATSCQDGVCAGDAIAGGSACDGKGTCAAAPPAPCFPYTCDPTSNRCTDSCTTSSDCAAGQQCLDGACGKSLNGQPCQTADRCASGNCVDGVCCNVACAGECMSCNQVGQEGSCMLLGAGLPDPDFCIASSPSTCGTTGRCDGLGACARFPANTLCGAAACATDVLQSAPQTCDGLGSCRAAEMVDCSPARCVNGTCNRTCASDADCVTGHPCVLATVNGVSTGTCSGLKSNGQTCGAASDCNSGQCVDGVCCESACPGPCRSCGVTGSLGRCVNVAAGAADPRKTCTDQGTASCATDGLCDGAGACEKYRAGTVCAAESCAAGSYTPAATCTAAGQCATPAARGCSPFTCTGTKCVATCSSNAQCAGGFVCVNGSCGLKAGGNSCSGNAECSSLHCAQGVCCNTACAGACTACNVAGSVGTCRSVTDGSPDPQGMCVAKAADPCGQTGTCRAGACAVRATGTACGSAACNGLFSVIPAPTCDGQGTCVQSPAQFCSFFGCANGACR
jgi:hypothetical protein